jgi:hypothetical protein
VKNDSILLMKTPLLAMAAAKKEKAANGDLQMFESYAPPAGLEPATL